MEFHTSLVHVKCMILFVPLSFSLFLSYTTIETSLLQTNSRYCLVLYTVLQTKNLSTEYIVLKYNI